MTNKFTGTSIEFHILQSFPVSCLNRDDVGSPKSAIVGGTERARVSSQCWKRAVRLAMHNLGTKTANRTHYVLDLIAEKCIALGAPADKAATCAKKATELFCKVKDGTTKSDTLMFISDSEAEGIAKAFKEVNFGDLKDLAKIAKNAINMAVDGLDMALFGRMVAQDATYNIQAAASFAHAISTHTVNSEVDFFTAVEDCPKPGETGSAHMGSIEFNSATYYRYIAIDLGTLCENLKTEDLKDAIEAFTKALFIAFPAARQATMAAACPWEYAVVTVRNGQRIQLPFTQAVKDKNILEGSKKVLKEQIADLEKMYGSLYGLKTKIEMGQGIDTSIDDLIRELQNAI